MVNSFVDFPFWVDRDAEVAFDRGQVGIIHLFFWLIDYVGSVSTLVALVAGEALIAEELVNAFAAAADVFCVGGYLSIKVVNTVVTFINIVVGLGLPLGAGVSIYTDRCFCGWHVNRRCNTSFA